jgi:hypothetical protein
VHVQDISAAFLAVLEAPRDAVHARPSTSAAPRRTSACARWRRWSRSWCPGARYATPRVPARSALLPRRVRQASPTRAGVPADVDGSARHRGAGGSVSALRAARRGLRGRAYVRLKRVRGLVARGRLDEDLRWS